MCVWVCGKLRTVNTNAKKFSEFYWKALCSTQQPTSSLSGQGVFLVLPDAQQGMKDM